MSEIRRPVLGRGLAALLNPSFEEGKTPVSSSLSPPPSLELPLQDIMAGQHQPRRSFSQEELAALSVSVKEKGVLQPIIVRIHPLEKGKYEIVAGERRWRAAKMIHLPTIPAIVRDFSDSEVLEVGLLENLQRQDLDPIDEACGYRRLAEDFNHTQESLSRIVGKSRSYIANTLRLLTLPETVQEYLRKGQLSAGHGRAIIGSENPEFLAEIIIEKNLNVRQAETLAKQDLTKQDQSSYVKSPDPEKEILRQHLSDLLGVPVDLILKGMGGKVVIPFKNPNELDSLIQKLNTLSTSSESEPHAYVV